MKQLQTKLIIRPALSSDANSVAPLIYSAGPEMFDYWLTTKKHSSLSVIEDAFAANAGIQGYGCHWVAEVDGTVKGVVASYTGKESNMLDNRLALWMVQYFRFYLPEVAKRGLKLTKLIKPIPKDLLFMANLGVSPDTQGQGIGSTLLKFHQQRAKYLAKVNSFGLDVATTNPNAQRLYERLGMSQIWEKKFADSAKNIPSSRRMTMAVSDII